MYVESVSSGPIQGQKGLSKQVETVQADYWKAK